MINALEVDGNLIDPKRIEAVTKPNIEAQCVGITRSGSYRVYGNYHIILRSGKKITITHVLDEIAKDDDRLAALKEEVRITMAHERENVLRIARAAMEER